MALRNLSGSRQIQSIEVTHARSLGQTKYLFNSLVILFHITILQRYASIRTLYTPATSPNINPY